MKMARKGEKCKQKLISDFQNGRRRPFWEKKWNLRFHLKWREIQTKINFGHPKWPPAAILWKKMKVAFSSELTRNANVNEFRTSKMAAGCHFVKKKWKLHFDLKWQEMQTKINFGHPKWLPAAILSKKMKVVFWSEMVRNANENEFQTSKLATGGHFEKRMKVLIISLQYSRARDILYTTVSCLTILLSGWSH